MVLERLRVSPRWRTLKTLIFFFFSFKNNICFYVWNLFFSKFQHGFGRRNTFGIFKSKIAFNLEIEAAMDAAITRLWVILSKNSQHFHTYKNWLGLVCFYLTSPSCMMKYQQFSANLAIMISCSQFWVQDRFLNAVSTLIKVKISSIFSISRDVDDQFVMISAFIFQQSAWLPKN